MTFATSSHSDSEELRSHLTLLFYYYFLIPTDKPRTLHNDLARFRTQTSWPGVQRTNHCAIASPHRGKITWFCLVIMRTDEVTWEITNRPRDQCIFPSCLRRSRNTKSNLEIKKTFQRRRKLSYNQTKTGETLLSYLIKDRQHDKQAKSRRNIHAWLKQTWRLAKLTRENPTLLSKHSRLWLNN